MQHKTKNKWEDDTSSQKNVINWNPQAENGVINQKKRAAFD